MVHNSNINTLIITILFGLARCQDVTAPTISCPTDTTVNYPDSTDPLSTGAVTCTDDMDPSPVVTHSDAFNDGCNVNIGILIRTWVCVDADGNLSSCDQTIEVQDVDPPVFTCPPDIVGEYLFDTSPAFTGTATCADDADPNPISTFSDVITPGACVPEDIITRTWDCVDCTGNSASCAQVIMITDTTDPILSGCPADTVINPGEPIPPTAPVSCSDNYGIHIIYNEYSTPCDNIVRNWTCNDPCDNIVDCGHVITIICSESPTTSNPTTAKPTTVSPTTSNPTTATAPKTTDSSDSASLADESDDDSYSPDSPDNALFAYREFMGNDDDDIVEKEIDIIVDDKTKWNLIAICILFVFVNGIVGFCMYCFKEKKLILTETKMCTTP